MELALLVGMRPKSYHPDPQALRYRHQKIFLKADELLATEQELIRLLYDIDQTREYVYLGYNSLMGYCVHALHLTRTQSQRLVTQVRRSEPTSNICHRSTNPAHLVSAADRLDILSNNQEPLRSNQSPLRT